METTQTTTTQTTTPQTLAPPAPTIKTKCQAKPVKIIACVIGAFLVALIIFAAGVGVGLHKARYSYAFGQNYERNFIGGRQGMMGGGQGGLVGGMMRNVSGRDFRNANGVAGTIISINGNNLVVKDRNNNENNVTVTDKTIIRSGNNNLQLSDLKQNDAVVVMGSPDNSGVINADLIRVFAANVQNNSTNNQGN